MPLEEFQDQPEREYYAESQEEHESTPSDGDEPVPMSSALRQLTERIQLRKNRIIEPLKPPKEKVERNWREFLLSPSPKPKNNITFNF